MVADITTPPFRTLHLGFALRSMLLGAVMLIPLLNQDQNQHQGRIAACSFVHATTMLVFNQIKSLITLGSLNLEAVLDDFLIG